MNFKTIITIVIVILLYAAAFFAIWCIHYGQEREAVAILAAITTYAAKRTLS